MIDISTDPALVARWFQALSDETRVRIVEMLAGGERCVCELQSALDAYQSRLSFHLRRLKDAGLVIDRKEGRWVYYSLDPEALESMRAYLGSVAAAESATGAGCACGG
jgi:ArsR family transcriptional regulator